MPFHADADGSLPCRCEPSFACSNSAKLLTIRLAAAIVTSNALSELSIHRESKGLDLDQPSLTLASRRELRVGSHAKLSRRSGAAAKADVSSMPPQ